VLEIAAADAAAVQAEVDTYIATVNALSIDPTNTNGVNATFSFTTIELDIANIEVVTLQIV